MIDKELTHYEFLMKNKYKLYKIKNKEAFVQVARWWCELYFTTPEWKRKRRQIIKRCNGICESCTTKKVRDIHHLTYKNLGNESLKDLLGVCRECHKMLNLKTEPSKLGDIMKGVL